MEFDLNTTAAGLPKFVPELAIEPASIADKDSAEPLASLLCCDHRPQNTGLVLAGFDGANAEHDWFW